MKSNWLFGRNLDLATLFLPVWACWAIAFALPNSSLHSEIPLWVWVTVVIGIDVSHVWSSIHRTYFDKEEFGNHRRLFIVAPILSFVLSFGIAAISVDLFWRALAYVAVYHFVKQQFGFMRIYKAKKGDFRPKRISDNFIIYLSMLYPILYWHLNPDREFAWFVQGDFLLVELGASSVAIVSLVGNLLYVGLLLLWLVEEIVQNFKMNVGLPVGKILWVMTTAGNWFLGIVWFNSDLVFTITNVVAHGLPYLALIIFYQTKKRNVQASNFSMKRNLRIGLVIISSVFLFAMVEEYLWDMMVYRENEDFFSSILSYPLELGSTFWQLMAIGLLAVPQVTHYILDGFIWKNNEKNPYLKEILKQ
ncbi:MAG: hypothetical protein ABJG78_06930 [Cyclobacteriaceae bacterium]